MGSTAAKGPDEKFCPECGQIIRAKAEICPHCGVRVAPPPSSISFDAGLAPNGKSKLAAALFAILLGGLGVHKFYLGQIGWGIVYLIFCWTFIPSLIGIIEGIVLLVMPDAEFVAKYGLS
ncbi:MAG: NINE protein [Terriglobales bacterium]